MMLRTRLLAVAALVIVVLCSVGVLLPRIVHTSLAEQVDHQIEAAAPIAFGLVQGARMPGASGPPPGVTRLSELYVAHIAGGSREVAVAPASLSGREPKVPQTTTIAGSDPKPVTVGSVRGGGSWRAIRIVLPDNSSAVVALSLDRVDATMHRLVLALWFAGIAMLVAMVAGGWWLWRLGLRPIADVTSVADAIAAGDRSRRVREGLSGTEAAHLARAFNVMLDEQQASEDRVRRFVSDASHELRTPVAAIGGFADLWRQSAIDGDERLGEMMRRIGQESTRMRALVEDLLLLARLDEGRPIARGPVDLAALARDAALDASATHPSRTVVVDSPVSVVVDGDEAGLRQVVANLVTNALVHAGDDATVRVGTHCSDRFGVLTVTDDGVGMRSEDTTRAFDRFWRTSPARARSGSGLGLSIVRSVVDAHGGQVDLRSAPGAGTTVRLVLPVAPVTAPNP
jgi:two-component system, OmpR family, sensor kinase